MTDTITLPRSVLEQALSTLEGWGNYDAWVWHESALSTAKENTAEMIPALRAALEQAQVEQEPYIWYCLDNGWTWTVDAIADRGDTDGMIPLYTNPQPPRQPLTDEEIRKIGADLPEEHRFHSRMFARAIERAHGIGGEA